MNKIATLPNAITAVRILGTLCLLRLQPGTQFFFAVYLLCGLSDVADGCIARATKRASTFGAKLDSVADLLFYAVMLMRLFPFLWAQLPGPLWAAAGLAALLRLSSYLVAAFKFRRFASLHTYANKLTGAAVFCVPFLIMLPWNIVLCWAVCVIAVLSSAEELVIHLRASAYQPDRKSLFFPFPQTEQG